MIRELGWVWQFVTYMFLHGSFFHIFFNMYALFLFGRPLEERWGWKEFLSFYLITGVGAGIVTFFWYLMKNPFVPTIGASGAIFGLILAFGLEFPDTVLLLFFIIPLRAKYAAFIFGGIELVMILTGSLQGIGHLTHLAGLLFGYLYYLLRIRGVRIRAPQITRKVRGRVTRVHRDALIKRTLQIREKLARGIPLKGGETAFLSRLREAYASSRGSICGEDEFNPDMEFCKRCDDFEACLYRYVIDQL
jgi:membrane associated rhomboid family serine protease